MVKGILLTPRDHDLLIDLYDLIFLDMDYLKKVIYLNEDDGRQISDATIYRRVSLLEQHGFIRSQRLQIVEKANPAGRSKKVFVLDEKGIEEVRGLMGEAKWDTRWVDKAPSHIYHTIELSSIKSEFKLKCPEQLEFYEWLGEQRGYFKSEDGAVIRPDGMLLLHLKKYQQHAGFFIEVERSRQRSIINVNKLKRYNRYCAEQNYKKHNDIEVKIPSPRILFASEKETEMKKLIEHTQDVDTSSTSGVLYTTLEKIKTDPYGRIFYAKGSANPEQLYNLLEPIQK